MARLLKRQPLTRWPPPPPQPPPEVLDAMTRWRRRAPVAQQPTFTPSFSLGGFLKGVFGTPPGVAERMAEQQQRTNEALAQSYQRGTIPPLRTWPTIAAYSTPEMFAPGLGFAGGISKKGISAVSKKAVEASAKETVAIEKAAAGIKAGGKKPIIPKVGKVVPKLPPELAVAKPRYRIQDREYIPSFESDLDKALYIVRSIKTLSAKDSAYLEWLRQQFPGIPDAQIRAKGTVVSQRIKDIAKTSPEGDIIIPDLIKQPQAKPLITPAETKQALPQGAPESAAVKGAIAPTVPAGQARAVPPEVIPKVPEVLPGGKPVAGGVPPKTRKPIWEGITEKTPFEEEAAADFGVRAEKPAYNVIEHAMTPDEWTAWRARFSPKTMAKAAEGGGQPPKPLKPGAAGAGGGDSQLDLAIASMTPDKKPVGDILRRASDAIMEAMWSSLWPIYKLQTKARLPVFKLAERVSGAAAEGQSYIAKHVFPVIDKISKDVAHLKSYMKLKRDTDILARNPHAKLPGGVQQPLVALEQLKLRIGPERYAAIEDAARQLWDLNRQDLDYLVERGLLSSTERTAITAAHPHYTPFFREDFAKMDIPAATRRSVGSLSDNDIERMLLEGSERKLTDTLDAFVGGFIHRRVLIARNDTAKGIHLALQEVAEAMGEALPKVSRKAGDLIEDRNWGVISYLDKGEQIRVQVPKAIADAAKRMDPDAASMFVKGARKVTAPLRMGATTYNLGFALTNIIRDTLTAMFRGKMVPLSRSYRDAVTAVAKKNADFDRLAKSGGFLSGIISVEGGVPKIGVRLAVKTPKDAALLLPRALQKLNLGIEETTRAAMGMKIAGQTPKQYITLTGRDAARVLREANISVTPHDLDIMTAMRDTTVNFSRMGTVMQVVNAVIPFSNAGLHGTVNIGRTIATHPAWATGFVGAMSGASALVWLNNQRFETSKDIPQYYYQNYWPIQIGEGTRPDGTKFPITITIPKTQIGAVLSMPGEIIMRALWDSGDRSLIEDALDVAKGSLTTAMPVEPSAMSLLPPGLGTAVELQSNYDPYRGRPIVPRGEEGRLPEMQFGAGTSEMAIALGKLSGISPRKIEYAIKDYTAGAGSDAMWLTDLVLGALGYKSAEYGAVQEQPLTTLEQVSQFPVLQRLLRTQGGAQEQKGWESFNKAAIEGKRGLYAISPELNRLGVPYGPVSDNIGDRQLTPDERAQLQTRTNELVEAAIRVELATKWYQNATDENRKIQLSLLLDDARAQARAEFEGANLTENRPVAPGRITPSLKNPFLKEAAGVK